MNEIRMKISSRNTWGSEYYYYTIPDFQEMMFMLHLLRKGDLFIDAGANIGGWSLLAATRRSNIMAFEPVEGSFRCLCENFDLNPTLLDNIQISLFNLALSDKKGTLIITNDLGPGNKIISGNDYANICEINAEKLDDVCCGSPTLMKIDVEGHQLPLLRGAIRTLNKPSLLALVIEVFRSANYNTPTLRSIEAQLEENKFYPVSYDPFKRII